MRGQNKISGQFQALKEIIVEYINMKSQQYNRYHIALSHTLLIKKSLNIWEVLGPKEHGEGGNVTSNVWIDKITNLDDISLQIIHGEGNDISKKDQ